MCKRSILHTELQDICALSIQQYSLSLRRDNNNKHAYAGIPERGLPAILATPVTVVSEPSYVHTSSDMQATVEDTFDECVLDKNDWLMFGSKKTNNEAYQITHHWSINDGEKIENEIGNIAVYVKE
jgi:hypothetical protein